MLYFYEFTLMRNEVFQYVSLIKKKEQKKFKILNLCIWLSWKKHCHINKDLNVQIKWTIQLFLEIFLSYNPIKHGYNFVPDIKLLLLFYTCSRLNYMLYNNNVKEALCSISFLITIEKIVSEHQNTDVWMKWSAPSNRWVDMFSHFSENLKSNTQAKTNTKQKFILLLNLG